MSSADMIVNLFALLSAFLAMSGALRGDNVLKSLASQVSNVLVSIFIGMVLAVVTSEQGLYFVELVLREASMLSAFVSVLLLLDHALPSFALKYCLRVFASYTRLLPYIPPLLILWIMGRQLRTFSHRRRATSRRKAAARRGKASPLVIHIDTQGPSKIDILCAMVDVVLSGEKNTVVVEIVRVEGSLSALDSSPYLSRFGIPRGDRKTRSLMGKSMAPSANNLVPAIESTPSVSQGEDVKLLPEVEELVFEDPQDTATDITSEIESSTLDDILPAHSDENIIPPWTIDAPVIESSKAFEGDDQLDKGYPMAMELDPSPASSRRPSTPWSPHPADVAFFIDDVVEDSITFKIEDSFKAVPPQLDEREDASTIPEISEESSTVPDEDATSETSTDDYEENDEDYDEQEYEALDQCDNTPHLLTNFSDIQCMRDSPLGQGAYGAVYKGSVKGTSQLVAVKALKKGVVHENLHMDFLLREMDIMFHMKGERNFTKALGIFDCEVESIIVMPLYPNGSLLDLMESCGARFSEERSRFYCAQMIAIVDQLHKKCILHRDIKPDNFLLDENFHLVLSDFGQSMSFPSPQETPEATPEWMALGVAEDPSFPPLWTFIDDVGTFNPHLAYDIVGTRLYAHSKVLAGDCYSYWADYFSVGVTLFEMLTGDWPYQNEENSEEEYDHTSPRVLHIPTCSRTGVSFEPSTFVFLRRMLHGPTDRNSRFQDVGSMKSSSYFRKIDWNTILSPATPVPA